MLDPWIIDEINKREEEKKRREEESRREQPTVPADDPREMPERRDDRRPDPGYEMPDPNDRQRDERPKDSEESGRGVVTIDIGGNDDTDDDERTSSTIDIREKSDIPPEDGFEERSG